MCGEPMKGMEPMPAAFAFYVAGTRGSFCLAEWSSVYYERRTVTTEHCR
jgi:hypothetical protein